MRDGAMIPRARGRAIMRVVPADRSEDCAAPSSARRETRFDRAAGWRLRAAMALTAWSSFAAFAERARAEPQTTVVLQYESAPDTSGCPGVEELESSVQRQLGYDPFRPAAERRVEVQIARKGKGFAGWIRWSDASGRWVGDRRLWSPRSECSEIAANVAFAVAVQIQLLAALAPAAPGPTAPQTAPATSPAASATSVSPTGSASKTRTPDATATSPAQPSSPATLAPPPPQPPESTARRARLRLFAGLGPSLALGVAPHLTALGRLYLGARYDPFSLELGMDGALPTTRRQADGSGFSLNQFAARAAACGHVQPFAACLTGGLGRIEARGLGLDKPAAPSGLFSQVGARIAATHELGDRFFANARVEGVVMLSRWSVALNHRVAWRTPRVGGLVGVDFGVFF